MQAFLSRPLKASGYAHLYLDATYLHGRLGRAACHAGLLQSRGGSHGVHADGRRELLGLKV